MRILQFGVFPPPNGGVQTNVKAIRDYVRERGHRCGVVNLTRHRQQDSDDVFYPKSPLQVMNLALTFPADILHFHLGGHIMPRLLALYLFGASLPRKKTILTFHSGGYPSSPEGRSAGRKTLRGFVFRRMDRIIAVNAEIVELFERFGVDSGRIRLIHPHSFPAAPPIAESPGLLREFLDAHGPVLTTVGLLEPEYDLPLQIEALGRILSRFPRAGLVIAGSGSQEQELRSLIASRPFAGHVLLFGDMPRDVTLNLISRADLFLRTTRYDGDSVSVREALHFGTPVIATENGMRPEGVDKFRVGDLEGLVQAMERRLQAPKAPPREGTGETTQNLQQVLDLYAEVANFGDARAH